MPHTKVTEITSKFGRKFYLPADGGPTLVRPDHQPDDSHLQPILITFECPKCGKMTETGAGMKLSLTKDKPTFKQITCCNLFEQKEKDETFCNYETVLELRLHKYVPFDKLKRFRVPAGFHVQCFNCSLIREPSFIEGMTRAEQQAEGAFTFKCAINLCKTVEEWFIESGVLKLSRRQRLGRWIHGK